MHMIRFGIAGFGLHGDRRLMPGFALAQNCKVTALSRRDPQKAAASARRYDIPHAFTSTQELCRCPDVDAVLVTGPDVLHRSDVLTAIAAGKPVLCEKPMAMNAAECQEMVEAARNANVLLGVAHVFRFEDSTAWLRDQVAAGAIGAPVFARVEFSYLGTGHGRTWLYDPATAAGGPVADVGVHCIDTLRFILQDDPVRVTVQLLDFDEKRLHFFMMLRHATDGWVSATSENLSLHVDMGSRKVTPFPSDILANLAIMKAMHARMPRPEDAGRTISISRRPQPQEHAPAVRRSVN